MEDEDESCCVLLLVWLMAESPPIVSERTSRKVKVCNELRIRFNTMNIKRVCLPKPHDYTCPRRSVRRSAWKFCGIFAGIKLISRVKFLDFNNLTAWKPAIS